MGIAALVFAAGATAIVALGISPSNAGRRAVQIAGDTVTRAAVPILAAWIADQRDVMRPGGAPVPPEIAAQLSGFFPQATLNRVRYHVGWPQGLAGAVFRLTEPRAIAFDNVILFRNTTIAADPVIWAHELAHVRQFEIWGTLGFAERYCRNRESVEAEAWQVAIDFKMWALQTGWLQ